MKKDSRTHESGLVEAARNGDREAFRALVEAHQGRVSATVIGMLGPGPEAEDIGQETFLRFYRALPKFRGDSRVATYLTRIALNLCFDAIKRRMRGRKLYFSDSEAEMKNAPDSTVSNNPGEARNLIRRGLQQLAPKFRSVLVLRLMDGYTVRETAEILGLPPGTVLSRMARAQEKMKSFLEGDGNENP